MYLLPLTSLFPTRIVLVLDAVIEGQSQETLNVEPQLKPK